MLPPPPALRKLTGAHNSGLVLIFTVAQSLSQPSAQSASILLLDSPCYAVITLGAFNAPVNLFQVDCNHGFWRYRYRQALSATSPSIPPPASNSQASVSPVAETAINKPSAPPEPVAQAPKVTKAAPKDPTVVVHMHGSGGGKGSIMWSFGPSPLGDIEVRVQDAETYNQDWREAWAYGADGRAYPGRRIVAAL